MAAEALRCSSPTAPTILMIFIVIMVIVKPF
ncbi:putative membrane protein [Bradyrhizobium elkanii]|nr:putative membrane protein [Bradyrhizobium elkanii]